MTPILVGILLGLLAGALWTSHWTGALFSLVGAVAGYAVARRRARTPRGRGPTPTATSFEHPKSRVDIEAELQEVWARHLLRLFVALARADQVVRPTELDTAARYLVEAVGMPPGRAFALTRAEAARAARGDAAGPSPSLADVAAECRAELRVSDRLQLLDGLYRLALADGVLDAPERRLLSSLAMALEVPTEDAEAIAAMYRAG